jgi:hypothetical protein
LADDVAADDEVRVRIRTIIPSKCLFLGGMGITG